jgi:uncharacterized DUF497 family protein
MAAEWDPSKAKANLRKHAVRFADAWQTEVCPTKGVLVGWITWLEM